MSEVEATVVGMCLNHAKNFSDLLDCGITAEHFSDDTCRAVIQAMLGREASGERPNDLAALRKVVPGASFKLTDMMAAAPVSQSVRFYANELTYQRWLTETHAEMVRASQALTARKPFDEREATDAQLANLTARLLAGPGRADNSMRTAIQVADDWCAQAEEMTRKLAAGEKLVIPTPLPFLSRVLNGGWTPSSLYTVAARSGRGKTTFGVASTICAAASGAKVGFWTVEMPDTDIFTKLVSNRSEIVARKFRRWELNEAETDRAFSAVREIAMLPILFNHSWNGDLTAFEIACRRLKRRNQLDLAVLDYLGQVRIPSERFNSRFDEIREAVGRIKRLTTELKLPIIVLCQLNREAEKMGNPGKEHIADSDSVGRDSDACILLYRNENEQTLIKVDKNRWGPELKWEVDADLAKNSFREFNLNWEALFDGQ